MKGLVLAIATLFSASSFACRINISEINENVSRQLIENLNIDPSSIKSQELVKVKDFYPDIQTQSCPDASIYYHAFLLKDANKECSILTKLKVSYTKEEINSFSVLDIDCE